MEAIRYQWGYPEHFSVFEEMANAEAQFKSAPDGFKWYYLKDLARIYTKVNQMEHFENKMIKSKLQ